MEKPILLWDRSQCREMICTCHDSSSPPRFCSGCGCNVASPGHRNTLDVIDRQTARIRELEGALARAVRFVEGYRAMHDGSAQDANPGARCACWHCHNSRGIGNSFGSTRPEDARRILAEGSVKP